MPARDTHRFPGRWHGVRLLVHACLMFGAGAAPFAGQGCRSTTRAPVPAPPLHLAGRQSGGPRWQQRDCGCHNCQRLLHCLPGPGCLRRLHICAQRPDLLLQGKYCRQGDGSLLWPALLSRIVPHAATHLLRLLRVQSSTGWSKVAATGVLSGVVYDAGAGSPRGNDASAGAAAIAARRRHRLVL
jgi:hypothetical protein